MSRITSSAPPAPHSTGADRAPPAHVPIANDGGIEGIVLQLEEQSRRSRELRNDARDARREQQSVAIRQAHKSARLALAGSLVKQVAQAAGSLTQSLSSGGGSGDSGASAPKSCTTGAETQGAITDIPTSTTTGAAGGPTPSAKPNGPNSVASSTGATWGRAGMAAAEAGGTLLDHFATRATTRAEVARNAAGAYDEVAEDAAQAEQDATRMADRALQHLDAILTARRDAEAAILRG